MATLEEEVGSGLAHGPSFEFATFLALMPGQKVEGVTVRDSLGPLLSLVSSSEGGNFTQAARSLKCDCLNYFLGCLTS